MSEKKSELIKVEVDELMAKEIQHLQLKDDPFIPEDLGFKQTVQEENDGTVSARIYSMNGFNIARPVELDSKYWVVMGPDGTTNKVLLPNMYNAIITLQACGMPISADMYYQGEIKDTVKKIDQEVDSILLGSEEEE